MLQWLIIGGGIHGAHLAIRLVTEAGVARDALRIVDPAPRLLHRWKTLTSTTGMAHLRSPAVHHLGLRPGELQKAGGRNPGAFATPYNRPSLRLFNSHCDAVLDACGLHQCHQQARVSSVELDDDGARVAVDDGSVFHAQNVVLAMGNSDVVERPAWAGDDDRVQHVFAPNFAGFADADDVRSIAVVGGGISAAQVALRLMRAGHDVHLVSRHARRVHQFDSDPGWLGPKHMAAFSQTSDVNRRRQMIQQARHRGSCPPDVDRALRRAVADGRLQTHLADIEGLCSSVPLEVALSTSDVLCVDRVYLATGFSRRRPGGSLVDDLIAQADLPCAACGHPVVGKDLRWHPHVVVMGPLAELELGPVARNIAGARRAADRVIDALQTQRRVKHPPSSMAA